MNLVDVYKKIEDNDVQIFSFGISGIKGLTICTDGNYGVFINDKEIENSDEEFCVVAHEYGHCTTGTLYSVSSDKFYISQCEYRADRKAILTFLPTERLNNAIYYGCQTSYEFSEYLGLPEKFVVMAFKHYRGMGLI